MRQGSAAASASSAAPADDYELGRHAPARLVKRLKKASQQRELTETEQAALAVAKAEWNKERAERRQRKRGSWV